jgi:hypothetical protein
MKQKEVQPQKRWGKIPAGERGLFEDGAVTRADLFRCMTDIEHGQTAELYCYAGMGD